jgi:L-threonylcarbamoyladenylate synthase
VTGLPVGFASESTRVTSALPLDTEMLAPDTAGVNRAAQLLCAGHCVAFPTETVYGLGADATDPRAVAGIYEAKGRPRFNPLIAHVADLAAAEREGVFTDEARRLAEAFWPGPLTLVVPLAATAQVCDLARAGLPSIALRVPDHPIAQDLLRQVERPLAAPSANPSGRISPTDADHVRRDLNGRIAAVLDGGQTQVGLESTIIACLAEGPRLLRPGGLDRAAIEAVLGHKLAGPEGSADAGSVAGPIAPGMLSSHYAPHARVRLDADAIMPGEAALLFGPDGLPGLDQACAMRNLSESGDLREAAANLFSHLRVLDETGADSIAIAPVPSQGLGEAIRDRLTRAAADRG